MRPTNRHAVLGRSQTEIVSALALIALIAVLLSESGVINLTR